MLIILIHRNTKVQDWRACRIYIGLYW